VESGGIHFIVEADIRGFFDNVEHEWLMKFLGHRNGDKRVMRYMQRFLKAGVFEVGGIAATEQGTPQGGVISPLLANIYLHYSLDLWYTRVFSRTCAGRSRLIRYAGGFVVCFQQGSDAQRFRMELEQRLGLFGLEVAAEKTKVLESGPFAASRAKQEARSPRPLIFWG